MKAQKDSNMNCVFEGIVAGYALQILEEKAKVSLPQNCLQYAQRF